MRLFKKLALSAAFLSAFFFHLPIYADADVIDLSQQNDTTQDTNYYDDQQNEPATPMPMMQDSSIPEQNNTVAPIPAVAPPIDTSNLSTEQRLTRLEQQVNNIVQMNLPARLDALQQVTEKLSGQSEQQEHELKALKDQLRDFYKDLGERINQTKTNSNTHESFTKKDVTGSSLNSASTSLPSASAAIASETEEGDHQQLIPKEQKAYEDAFNLLQQKKYSAAAQKLHVYLKSYPNGTYAINAHYWLAECYYLLGQLNDAAKEFTVITAQHPNSTKTPDALLKLGIIHETMGKHEQARKEFLQVKKRFPESNAAKSATRQLNNMTTGADDNLAG